VPNPNLTIRNFLIAVWQGDALQRQMQLFAAAGPGSNALSLGRPPKAASSSLPLSRSAKAAEPKASKRPGRERERDGVENRDPRR
jgi:hypothetical protein